MSDLCRCDRCGETTAANGDDVRVLVRRVTLNVGAGVATEQRDLCPHCRADVLAVMREVVGVGN